MIRWWRKFHIECNPNIRGPIVYPVIAFNHNSSAMAVENLTAQYNIFRNVSSHAWPTTTYSYLVKASWKSDILMSFSITITQLYDYIDSPGDHYIQSVWSLNICYLQPQEA